MKLEILDYNDVFEIRLDIVFVTESLKEDINVERDYDEIVSNIIKIIEEFGYTEIHHGKSPKSTTIYVTFCDKSKYMKAEVDLVARMRVADHELRKHKDDKTKQDAVNRQIQKLKSFYDDHSFISANLQDKTKVKFDYIYVEYENEYYTYIEDLYKKIRRELSEFKNKHKNDNMNNR